MPCMKKRHLAAFLWFYAGWYAGALIAEFVGVSALLGKAEAKSYAEITKGGTVRSALQLVGERGPELVALPQRSEVFTAAETRAMLSGHSGGSTRSAAGATIVFERGAFEGAFPSFIGTASPAQMAQAGEIIGEIIRRRLG